MSRTLSLTMRGAMNAQETGEVPIFLMTITHELLEEPIRLSSDPTSRISVDPLKYGTASRGETYLFVPMGYVLPDEKDGAAPQSRITLDNVDRSMVDIVRSAQTPARVTMELVLASALDEVEIAFPAFDLVSAPYDASIITLHLAINALVTEPFPAGSFNPSQFPGLF
ncbi:hypothetical protein FG93_01935 [Bosea sp. LC85]|uniref:DUF1833 family protein n=1 Tax=Bosea sp. LC85 TaxID=1502851 RepID=UPI0004E46332|nr:DUF1833 family protein [Bosea sp. LC85]KFC73191.1 hypothetical protein FG93_01935 [Bosea sp. LC85]